NEVCDGPAPCTFRGMVVDPGSFAYASGAITNCPNGCPDPNQPPPQNQQVFRVAQVGICATAAGQALFHWQFNPPAPPTRDTEIVTLNGEQVQNRALFTDYTFTVVGVVPTLTNTPTSTPTSTLTNTPTSTFSSTP